MVLHSLSELGILGDPELVSELSSSHSPVSLEATAELQGSRCMALSPQVSMQLHNRRGALKEAEALLRSLGGFTVVSHFQEPRFAGCSLVQVVASRQAQDEA